MEIPSGLKCAHLPPQVTLLHLTNDSLKGKARSGFSVEEMFQVISWPFHHISTCQPWQLAQVNSSKFGVNSEFDVNHDNRYLYSPPPSRSSRAKINLKFNKGHHACAATCPYFVVFFFFCLMYHFCYSSATPVAFRLLPAASGVVESPGIAAPPHSQKKLGPPAVSFPQFCNLR